MNDRMRALAAEIRAERAALGMTQQALAEQTGLSKSTVVRIEAATRAADINQLAAIADALRMPLAELVERMTVRSGRRE